MHIQIGRAGDIAAAVQKQDMPVRSRQRCRDMERRHAPKLAARDLDIFRRRRHPALEIADLLAPPDDRDAGPAGRLQKPAHPKAHELGPQTHRDISRASIRGSHAAAGTRATLCSYRVTLYRAACRTSAPTASSRRPASYTPA